MAEFWQNLELAKKLFFIYAISLGKNCLDKKFLGAKN
jgi:hypothetical protein